MFKDYGRRARKSWFTLALTHFFQVLRLNLECEAIQQLSCKLMLAIEFLAVIYPTTDLMTGKKIVLST